MFFFSFLKRRQKIWLISLNKTHWVCGFGYVDGCRQHEETRMLCANRLDIVDVLYVDTEDHYQTKHIDARYQTLLKMSLFKVV